MRLTVRESSFPDEDCMLYYDVALYRPITMEAYQAILEQTAPYLAAEAEYRMLYA